MGEYSSDGFVARVHNEREDISVPEILAEADAMWKKCRKAKINIQDQAQVDLLMTRLRREHKEFSTSYPIIMRYMAQFGSYTHAALEKYLKVVESRPWKSEEEYLDSQADYAVILYKETHPRWNTSQVANLRKNIRATLGAESKMFKENLDKFEKKVTATETRVGEDLRRELEDNFKRGLPTALAPNGKVPPMSITLADD